MDPQFLYHQRDHSRYIPLPHPPPFDPSFHLPPNHHHVLSHIPEKPVDFPLPPPPPPSYRHLPMPPSPLPPSYNPSQPQFHASSSNHDDYLRIPDDRMGSMHPFRDFGRSPPVSGRISFNGGFHRDLSVDISDSSMIPRSPIDFERGTYHRGVDQRSVLPYSWMGAEYNDSFQTNPPEDVIRGRGDENYYHHGRFKTDSDVSFLESGAANVQNRFSSDKEFVSGSFDRNRYGSTSEKEFFRGRRSNVGCKTQRWAHSKQNSRNTHNSFLEMGNNDRGDGGHSGFRTISGKHGNWRPELGKYYNDKKGISEGYHEYTSTPRKQIPKKSALLRIQVENPSLCNRESEQLHDSEYFDNKNNSSLRGKSQLRSLVFRIDEGKKREESSMELDVSFKSNSLVAKAIVASSHCGATSDVDKIIQNEEIKEVLVPNHNFRQNKDTVCTENVTYLANSSGSKDELKESGEKVRGFSVENISNNSTEKFSSVSNCLLGKTNIKSPLQGKVLGKEGKSVVSAKVSTTKVIKKKKVVKKAVSTQLCSQTNTSGDEPVKVDGLTNIPLVVAELDKGLELSKRKSTVSGMSSLHHLALTTFQQEISGSLENKKADQSFLPIALEEPVARPLIGKENTSKDKSDNYISDLPMNSLIKEGSGNGALLERNSSVITTPPLLNANKDFKLLNGSNELDFDTVKSKKVLLGEAVDSVLENVSGREFEATMSSLEGSQSELLSFKDPYPRGDLVDGNRLAGRSDITMDFDDGVTQSQDNSPLSETCFLDEISKQLSSEKVTAAPKTGIIGVPVAEVAINNSLVGLSNSEEAELQIDSTNSECYDGSNQHTKGCSDDCFNCTDVQVNDILFNCENNGNSTEHTCMDRDSIELGMGSQERSSKTKVSVGGGEGKKSMSKMSEIKDCLGSASPRKINDETMNSKDLCVSFISKNYHSSEHDIFGLGSKVLGANSTTTGVSLIHGYSSLGKSPKNKLLVDSNVNLEQNKKPHECRKKRKIFVASPGLPCPNAECNEGPAITFTCRAEETSTSNGEFMEREEAAMSTVDALYTASSPDCSKEVGMILDDILMKEPANEFNNDYDQLEYRLKHKHLEENSCPVEELIVSQFLPVYPSALGNEHKENGAPTIDTNQIESMDIDIDRKKKLEVHVPKEKFMVCNETAEWRNSSKVPFSRTINCLHPVTGKTSDSLGQDNLHHLQNHMALSDDGNKCSSTNSHNEIMGCMFDAQVDLSSRETSNVLGIHNSKCEASLRDIDFKMDLAEDRKADEKLVVENQLIPLTDSSLPQYTSINQKLGPPETSNALGKHKSNCEASISHIDFNIDCADGRKTDENPVVENELIPLTDSSLPQFTSINQKLGHTDDGNNLSTGNVLPLALEESKKRAQTQNGSTDSGKKNQMGYYKSQTFFGKSFSSYIASKKLAPATHCTKPRSWHRNVNSLIPPPGNKAGSSIIPPQTQSHGRDGMLQSTSYIRKGHSLVRKSSPVAAQASESHDFSSGSSDQHDRKASINAYNKVDGTSSLFLFKASGTGTSVDKPYSPPGSSGSRSPDHLISLKDTAPSSSHETESDPMKSKHISDLSRSITDPSKILLAPESQTVCAKMENQSDPKNINSVSSIGKKIVYIKRKSNQLVATSNAHGLSTNNTDTIHPSHSDGYYKRNKNQLIRASLECQMKRLLSNDEISNPGAQSSSWNGDGRNFYKRQLCKAIAKTHRPSKCSLVWTLCSSVALGNGDRNLQNQKIVPRLFPWKRTYWGTLQSNTLTHKNCSSSIVRKLLLLRNRNTLYKRSKHGFSIKKSKVLSIGRSSLKWSKSIERRSKKANQEATRAVVDAEKNRRECNRDGAVCSEAQGGNQCSYDKSSPSITLQSEKGAKKFYIPRRLVIGNDEYVKIGNGNQLVRNPKRRARILANEKIRWSLHTARHRLAKKRKYCQFFTRFGKCDKDGGKCPYIHDTSKIAVCTKFLNGLCSNPSCKLTHKVIPERMPDCSYFLQGLCSSRNCAYRHVNVNPKATSCEAFLRGYCALGNECRKKHSYVCPLFEATGTCPEGSRCKLHHPRKQTKGRKRKRSEGKNNDHGRYFGLNHNDSSGSRVVVTEKHPGKSSEGDVADYISLETSDEEVEEAIEPTTGRTSFCEDYCSESLINDPDELIKPIRIMNKNLIMRLPEDSGGRT